MEADRELADYCIKGLLSAGADKAQCVLSVDEKTEFNVSSDEISLLRTTENADLTLTVIVGGRKGALAVNELDKAALSTTFTEVVELAKNSQPDPAHDFAPASPAQTFETGPMTPDLELMHDRLGGFLDYVGGAYPLTGQEEVVLDFTVSNKLFRNSNGVDLSETRGAYSFSTFFTSKEGKNSSSFNWTGVTGHHLDQDLYTRGSIDRLLRESAEQIETQGIGQKFVGDIILTPDCLGSFLGTLTGFLSDYPLISGNSIYKDSIGESIAHPSFTLHAKPVSDEVTAGYFVTGDGFVAEDSTVIQDGVLLTHLLSLYGANKTGKSRAVNRGSSYVIDPGDSSFEQMVSSIKKGIVLCRFSGGSPADNGDFSGVAKNSYYVEDGKVKCPISEVMISGNVAQMFKDIAAISAERVDYGNAILPWIQVGGLTVSG